MTSTDRLRAAAQKIRDTAQATYDGPTRWYERGDLINELDPASDVPAADDAHIALWSPALALEVADWLDDIAADKDSGLATIHPRALTLANHILGEEP